MTSLSIASSSALVGIGCIAQAVAEEVVGEHGETTAPAGQISSHEAVAMVRTFCASCSSTPQRTTGALRPMPRNDSAVSATIIVGSASVTTARMWLVSEGRMWRKISRRSRRAVELGGGDEVFAAEGKEASADFAREAGPAEQRRRSA